MTAFIASRKRSTLGALPEAAIHLAAPLLQEYAEKGIPVHTDPDWPQRDLESVIVKSPHASACTPKMIAFIRGDLHQRVQDGFSILLPEVYTVRVFRETLKLYCIVAVPQEHRRTCLILNLLTQPGKGTSGVN